MIGDRDGHRLRRPRTKKVAKERFTAMVCDSCRFLSEERWLNAWERWLVGQWEVEEPEVFPGINGDKGLVAKSKAAHHAISVPFPEALDPAGKPLVVQYEVKLQKGLECGGAYIKLLTESPDGIQAKEFSDKSEP